MRVFVIRHGQTESNKNRRLMGHVDTPLKQRSITTTKSLSETFKSISLDKIFTSDLGRSFITAYYFAKELDSLHLITASKKIREVDYGELTHMKKNYVIKHYPLYKKEWNYVFPKGESYSQVRDRVFDFLKKQETKGYDNILLVTHSGVIRCLMTISPDKYPNPLSLSLDHNTIYSLIVDEGILKDFKKYS